MLNRGGGGGQKSVFAWTPLMDDRYRYRKTVAYYVENVALILGTKNEAYIFTPVAVIAYTFLLGLYLCC